jgi:hypothetical protein
MMGNVATIRHDAFPRQSEIHPPGTRLWVFFHNDLAHILPGTVVRNDDEAPHRMIIRLDDGRYVLQTECQYSDDLPHGMAVQPE